MEIKRLTRLCILFINLGITNTVLADDLILDDRSSGDSASNLGIEWRLFTDQVMGGVSNGTLVADEYKDRHCLHMQGDVSTDNNGGFIQMSLSLTEHGHFDSSDYDGIELEVAGNNETYNIHVRTAGLWLPWQSYRASFKATENWQTIRIPFDSLEAYRTTQKLHLEKLTRIGVVGIGRNFHADLCLAAIKLYSAN